MRQKCTGNLITRRRYEGGRTKVKVKIELMCTQIYLRSREAAKERKEGRMPNEQEGAGRRVRKIEIDRKQIRRTEGAGRGTRCNKMFG